MCVLRGGKEAINSNLAFCASIQRALTNCGFSPYCVNVVSDTSRESAKALMTANGKIDVLIPRGGKGLIQSVVENATVPVIETGAGNCHVYVDDSANLDMANEIAFNARAQRPSVCNSAENLLVHEKIADVFLPMMQKKMKEKNVELRGCEKTLKILSDITPATEEDFYTEYGGAPLLGVAAPVIKAHGSSDAYAIRNAVRHAGSPSGPHLCHNLFLFSQFALLSGDSVIARSKATWQSAFSDRAAGPQEKTDCHTSLRTGSQ